MNISDATIEAPNGAYIDCKKCDWNYYIGNTFNVTEVISVVDEHECRAVRESVAEDGDG